MGSFSTIIPSVAALLALTQAVALPEPYTPPESYYPSPTYKNNQPTGTGGTYRLYPSSLVPPFTPSPVPERTVRPRDVVASSASTTTASPTPLCNYNTFGLHMPADGSTIVQMDNGTYGGTNITVLYCSSQYDKTHSIDIDVVLSYPNSPFAGEILAMNVKPGPLNVASAGYYGYMFNVVVHPINGQYRKGTVEFSVYERASGYYDPFNYQVSTNTLNFTVKVS